MTIAAALAVLLKLHTPPSLYVPLAIHIAGGSVAIVAGFLALFVVKGATVHRKSGVVFVYAMVVLGVTASVIAAVEGKTSMVLTGLFTAYFVVSAMTTVRPPTDLSRRANRVGMVVALLFGLSGVAKGIAAYTLQNGMWDGVPGGMHLFMGTILLLAATGDYRVLRFGELRGPRRIARHLWRMCYALFIATGSFFLGQAKVIPQSVRVWPVLFTLALLPLVMLLYWLWRIRVRQQLRGLVVRVATPETA